MLKINETMYTLLSSNLLGNASIGWVKFNNGMFNGKPTLLKYIPGNQAKINQFTYLNSQNFEIPLVALNPLVAEIVSKTGDPDSKVAEYFLVNQNNQILICSPSFKNDSEELIEGVDLLKSNHQNKKRNFPEDISTICDDIAEELKRRGVHENQINEITSQFIKDCFKIAYMELYDDHNTNWGILYGGIGKAKIAPLYDLDTGLNVPFECKDTMDPNFKRFFEDYIKKIKNPNYLTHYTSVISKNHNWFDSWVENFVNNIEKMDLSALLSEKKGILVPSEEIEHYTSFFKSRNLKIRNYLNRKQYNSFEHSI